MTSRDFCYWLQGYFELTEELDTALVKDFSRSQLATIKNHLNMVFIHEIDPSFPAEQQLALDAAHKPKPQIGGKKIINGQEVMLRC